jgi:hypothetical protein
MDPSTSTTSDYLSSPLPRASRYTHGMVPGALPRGLFVSEVLKLGLVHVGQDSFRGAAAVASLEALGRPVLVRADPQGEEVEAVLRLTSGALALIDAGYGHVSVEVAASTRAVADRAVSQLREALAVEAPDATRVSVAFWMCGQRGGQVRHREIDTPTFDDIADNYPATVRVALERLVAMREPERGRLILWRGEPGTGKSHALRALARHWSDWCSAHFIMDPSELFGHGGAYMLDVLTWSGDSEDRWRLLILEDAGDLIAADARSAGGQALSRLLNVADGLLGQGTRTLVLITTNEPVKRLHPAARRPGRCLADLEFAPLSVAEANAWLAARGLERRVDRPTPVAELYGSEPETEVVREDGAADTSISFGFARALSGALPYSD